MNKKSGFDTEKGKLTKEQTSLNISDIFSTTTYKEPIRGGVPPPVISFDLDAKKHQLRKLVKHYFNGHLQDRHEMAYQLKLVKIYFTFKILKNPYLAHFLLFNFQEDDDGDSNFLDCNQRLLNQRYVDELISQRQLQI